MKYGTRSADAVALLDELHVQRAHLVGISMGGGIAQRMAVVHPDRVASVTLLSTSPGGPSADDLPPMSARVRAHFADAGPDPDWADRSAYIDFFLTGERVFAGSLPVDEPRVRAIAGRAFDRSVNPASHTNHWRLTGGEPVRPRLGEITAPALVVHGTEDPLFPFGHGEKLAEEIPGATLFPLPGVGHQMPPPQVWDVLIPAILAHTA